MWFGTQSATNQSVWRYEPPAAQGAAGSWTEFTDADGQSGAYVMRLHTLMSLADGSLLVGTMRPVERFKQAQQLRGAAILEDDFSFLEIRFP